MKTLILTSLLLTGFNYAEDDCVRGTQECVDKVTQCVAELHNTVDKVESCANSLEKAKGKTEAMITRYTCNFLKLGDDRYPRMFRWPDHTRSKYNRVINKIYASYIEHVECVWATVKPNMSLQQCRPCDEALETCINNRDWESLRLTWCEMSHAETVEHFEIQRNRFACTIQAFLNHMPEGKRALERRFSEAERKINDPEQCVDVDKAVDKLSKTSGRGN